MRKPAWLDRLVQITGAWGIWTVVSKLYDEVLYPYAIYKLGPLIGGVLMTGGSILICLLALLAHVRDGRDWLGVNVVETIKREGREYIQSLDAKVGWSWWLFRWVLYIPSRSFLVVLWALRKSDLLAFGALSIMKDPFVTTIFLRHGRTGPLGRRDWLIFVMSVVVSNCYWILRSTLVVEALKLLWPRLSGKGG